MDRILKSLALMVLLTSALWAAAEHAPANVPPGDPGEGYGEEAPPASYLGIDVRDVSADRLAALKLKEESGAEITMVDQDAPAGKAGLKEHDVILQLNGQKIESVEQLRRMLRETPPGRAVTLSISRDGQPMTIKATLADRRKSMSAMRMEGMKKRTNNFVMPTMPAMPAIEIPSIEINMRSYSRAGVVIESLTPQLGEYFGAKNGEGVLVRSVEKGSPAEKAGLKAGDVIIRVDKDRIADRSDWRNAMRKRSGKVAVGILRERREQTLTLTLPDSEGSDDSFRLDLPEVELDALDQEVERLGADIEQAGLAVAALSADEIDRAVHQAQAQAKREMDKACKEIEKANKEMERARKEREKQKREPTE